MIGWGAAALSLLFFGGADEPRGEQYAQVTVRQQIIVRIPQGLRQISPAGASMIEWREGRGPRCVASNAIVGATLLSQNSVDLILRNNSRVRAQLEDDCPALDYYHGFYVAATPDGQICSDRDVIRSRMGGQCEIERFRSLRSVPNP